MRKLLLMVVVLSLGTFALAQAAGSDSSQVAGNDWYNQQLSANVQQFQRIAAATAPSLTAQAEGQSGTLPASMAAHAGSQETGNDWYNQRLSTQVQEFDRIAATLPAKTSPAQ
jgi:hypothetical protein